MKRLPSETKTLQRVLLSLFTVVALTSSLPLGAQPAATPATAVTPVTEPAQSTPQTFQNSSAVQNIPEPSFFDNILDRNLPLYFGLTVGEMYDDNILISPQKTSDFITHISPNIDYQMGEMNATDSNYLNVYFEPTIFLYNQHSQFDREDYNADLYYQYQWSRLTLGIEQQYQHLTDGSIDLGRLATRDIYTTQASGNYAYNDNLGIFGTATQQISAYQQAPAVTINQWTGDVSALYQVASKLWLGAGPRISVIDISGAPNEQENDFLARLKYNPGGKITMTFAGGVEYLEYQGSTPSHLLPIAEFTGTYTPFDGTQISLSATRESINSFALDGETIIDSTVQGSVRQRFLQNFFFTVSAGYTNSDYKYGAMEFNAIQNGPRREDDYYFVNAGLEWDANNWLTVNGSYQYSEDDSNFAQNSFNDNRVNLEAAVHF
jgi:hypothetical protein